MQNSDNTRFLPLPPQGFHPENGNIWQVEKGWLKHQGAWGPGHLLGENTTPTKGHRGSTNMIQPAGFALSI